MTRTDIVVRNVPDVTRLKMMRMKEADGFAGKDWLPWFQHLVADVHLEDSPAEMVQKHTRDGLLEVWVKNLAQNLPRIWDGKTIRDLVPEEARELEAKGEDPDVPVPGKSAIVVGRGPSLKRQRSLSMLRDSGYRGTLMLSDGALVEALEAGIKPPDYEGFYVMTVDGNHDKIWKWYSHPLVDQYGKSIKAVLCTAAAPNVAERCEEAGVEVYWFHPMFDNWRNIESFTKIEQLITKCERHPNGVPAMQAGGNAGAAAWVLSWLVLRRNPVALIGMDLGYLPDDDLSETYYWGSMMEATRGNVLAVQTQYASVFNPDLGVEAIVDPVFAHYRQAFQDMALGTPRWLQTMNCTGGGSLFGEGITTVPFAKFLGENKA